MPSERLSLLLVLLAPGMALARGVPVPTEGAERSFLLDIRAGGGFDSNVLRDPQATTQAGVVRVDLASELEATRYLKMSFLGWFEEHIPLYDINELSLDLLLTYRRPIANRLRLVLGSLGSYRRELSNFVEGTVLTHGSTLVTQLDEHASAGLELQLGQFDLQVAGQGNVKNLSATETFNVYGVGGSFALRWVPSGYVSLRARYLFLFEDVKDLLLLDLTGQPVGFRHDLYVRTHQVDFSIRLRPIEALNLSARYELAFVDDNYLGYLYGQEHRVVAAVRFEPARRWIAVDVSGRLVSRKYPLRVASPDNQVADLQFEAIADLELWPHKNWGVFARYELGREEAMPFGLLYMRHAAVAGVAVRSGLQW